MPALVAGIHVLHSLGKKDVDGRNKSGHDVCGPIPSLPSIQFYAIPRRGVSAPSILSNTLQKTRKTKEIAVEFGKRFSVHNNRPAPVMQETCVRCCGTGRIRERGNRIICKPCAGTGRITVVKDRAS
jgi:hypothetical protein